METEPTADNNIKNSPKLNIMETNVAQAIVRQEMQENVWEQLDVYVRCGLGVMYGWTVRRYEILVIRLQAITTTTHSARHHVRCPWADNRNRARARPFHTKYNHTYKNRQWQVEMQYHVWWKRWKTEQGLYQMILFQIPTTRVSNSRLLDAKRLVETRPDSDKFRLVYFALEIWSLKIVPTGWTRYPKELEKSLERTEMVSRGSYIIREAGAIGERHRGNNHLLAFHSYMCGCVCAWCEDRNAIQS